jgi:uncharacterized protein YqjF (DUF2071 family)
MSVFLTAEWRKLMMVQYAIDPGILASYLPHGVELDLYRDSAKPAEPPKCFVSLVGFLFDRVRVKGIAFPFHTRFPEVNLRFYVKRTDPSGELHRGVVFVNEFVPSRNLAVALLAKQLYEEPYRALPMRYSIKPTAETLDISYDWQTGGRWHSMGTAADATSHPIAPASVEEFITEHYWGYTKRSTRNPAGRTSAYPVEHPRWQVYPIRSWKLDLDYAAMYGPRWDFLTSAAADNVLLAEGSAVKIYTGSDLTF